MRQNNRVGRIIRRAWLSLGAALAVILFAPACALAMAPSQVAPAQLATADVPRGPLSIEPQEGNTETGEVRLVTGQLCPEQTTNYLVRISGAGFTAGQNAVGNEAVSNLSQTYDGKGLVVPMWGTWQMVADADGVKDALNGVATLTMFCMDKFGKNIYAMNVGEIEFKAQGGKSPSTYRQVGGPKLASGQPRTPAEVEAAARNDGSFPPPNEGTVEISKAAAPDIHKDVPFKGSSSSSGGGDVQSAPADSTAIASGDSDVKSDAPATDLAASEGGGGGSGGLSTAAIATIVLLLALLGAGGVMYRATRSS